MPKHESSKTLFATATIPGDNIPLVNQSGDDDIPFTPQTGDGPITTTADIPGQGIDGTIEYLKAQLAEARANNKDLADRCEILNSAIDIAAKDKNRLAKERDIAVQKANEYSEKISELQRETAKAEFRREVDQAKGPYTIMSPTEDPFSLSRQIFLALLTGFASRGDLSRRAPGQASGGVADDTAVINITKHIAGITAFAVEAAKAARI